MNWHLTIRAFSEEKKNIKPHLTVHGKIENLFLQVDLKPLHHLLMADLMFTLSPMARQLQLKMELRDPREIKENPEKKETLE